MVQTLVTVTARISSSQCLINIHTNCAPLQFLLTLPNKLTAQFQNVQSKDGKAIFMDKLSRHCSAISDPERLTDMFLNLFT